MTENIESQPKGEKTQYKADKKKTTQLIIKYMDNHNTSWKRENAEL
jgi:hypothetical protein